jgi:tripartite-type tricarboxylate transporter receptor subunit TctC
MVRPDFPAKTLAELVALAKVQPGKLSAGSGGAGGQVSIALLKAKADIDLIDVPYKGVPQSVTDVLGGSLNIGAFDLGNAMPQIQSGKLRPLAVTLSEPTSLAPGVPTVAETFPGFEVVPWHGLVAPAGTPPQIIAKLHDAAANALAKPEIKAAFANTGNVVAPLNPTEFSKFIQSEIPKWATLVKVGGLKPD